MTDHRQYPPHARAALALAVALQETADQAFTAVAEALAGGTPQDQLAPIIRVRTASAIAWERAILSVLLRADPGDEPYADIAGMVGLTEATLRARFQPAVDLWRCGPGVSDPGRFGDHAIGLLSDPDPRGTAEALDAWLARHRDPWDAAFPDSPVTTALAGL